MPIKATPKNKAQSTPPERKNVGEVEAHKSTEQLVPNASALKGRLLNWHHDLAQITGAMSLTYGKKGVKRGVLTHWAVELKRLSDDIAAAAAG